jgi:serine/threonine-protein phosphatase 6 regulatory subunit 3
MLYSFLISFMVHSFIQRLFHQALEATDSRSTLVHSLSVCVSLLDPKKYVVTGMGRGQQILDSVVTINPEVIHGMLQRLGEYF